MAVAENACFLESSLAVIGSTLPRPAVAELASLQHGSTLSDAVAA